VTLNTRRNLAQELRERMTTLRARIATEPDTVSASRLVTRNPTLEELERKRLDLVAERALELNRFQPGSPAIAELDQSIQRIVTSMSDQPSTVVSSESLAQNGVRTTLQTDLHRAETDYAATLAGERTLLAQIESLNSQIRRLDSDVAALRRLTQASATAAKIYNAYLEEREAARIAKQTDSGVTNLQVLSWAVPPSRPKHARMTLIAVGAVLGLVLGFVVAGVGELFAQTLDRRDDVERHLGLPVLAVMPETPELRAPSKASTSLLH
jgi:uncharacterized protein involved in exopolysaccharide biosynthesis